MSVARLTYEAIDAATVLADVAGSRHGAILLFLGVVRDVNDGRGVTGIEYSAYESMATRELHFIATEAASRVGDSDVAIVHRIGALALEETSVAIAVAHAHRAEAYELSRWVIEELKRRVPIWKREQYTDGSREWVDPSGRSIAGHVP
ncbi:MAG: molybdenum cofactor biosynthesis protein MoaE [Gemmatimonadaceae bacterium]|nr:molybdenum cofactor biosynthesis protein MoaE [Gemmatimonadaceae bacterium]